MFKKTCSYMVKKSCSWLYFSQYVHEFVMLLFQLISEKIRLKKKCTTCEKKHIYLSWKSCIIFGVLAPIYLIRKYHIFLQQKYGFLGVGFLLGRGGGGLFIAPAWTFPDVLLYSAPLPNLYRTSEVDDYRTAQALDPVEFLGEWLAPSTPPKRKKNSKNIHPNEDYQSKN